MAHPAEMEWLAVNMDTNSFAMSLEQDVDRHGALTDRQLAAVLGNIERGAARTTALAISVAEIEAKFAIARSRMVKKPAMRLDSFVFKAAGDKTANAGAIYVTEDGEYLGKVMGGKFLRVRECSDDQQARIIAAASNPEAAAKAYGQRTGNCSICGRELTAEESLERFIGPICIQKFGF
jgi:hypothetical protein